jgi:hypothetical protein
MEFIYELIVRPISNYGQSHDDFRLWLEREAVQRGLGGLITCRVAKARVSESTTHAFVCFKDLHDNRRSLQSFQESGSEFDGRVLEWSPTKMCTCVVPLAIGPIKREVATQVDRVNSQESGTQCEFSLYSGRLMVGREDRVRSSSLKRRMGEP